MNNCAVIIHHSLHPSRSQNPSIFSIFRGFFSLSLSFLSLNLRHSVFSANLQPTIISVLGHSCVKFEYVCSCSICERFIRTSPILQPTLSPGNLRLYTTDFLIIIIIFIFFYVLREIYWLPGLYSGTFPVKELLNFGTVHNT